MAARRIPPLVDGISAYGFDRSCRGGRDARTWHSHGGTAGVRGAVPDGEAPDIGGPGERYVRAGR